MERICIAGASIAGISAARELRRGGFVGTIDVFDADESAPYRRPEVSKGLIDGSVGQQVVRSRVDDELNLRRHAKTTLTGFDAASRRVDYEDDDGSHSERFDAVVIATGAKPNAYTASESAKGVHTLHGITDSLAFRKELQAHDDLVIVGGGFVGLEVASVAHQMGKRVTVLESESVVLGRILGHEFGEHLTMVHRGRGVNVKVGAAVTSLEMNESGHVESVALADGGSIPARVVVTAIGQRPAVDWLAGSGLRLANGVECDQFTAALSARHIVAAGDVASWMNPVYGRQMRVEHWSHAIAHGTYAARRLLGTHDATGFAAVPYFWSDQWGMKIHCMGSTSGFDTSRVLHIEGNEFVVAYGRDERLVAVASYGIGPHVMKFAALIKRGEEWSAALREIESVVGPRVRVADTHV